MPAFVDVPYRHEHDWTAILDLVLQSQLAAQTDRWPTIAELRVLCHPARTDWIKQVWLDRTDQIVAFALLDRIYGSLWFWSPPAQQHQTKIPQIITWALQQRQHDTSDTAAIRCQVREDALDSIALLRDFGFVQHDLCTVRMSRSLNQPIPEPSLPYGFSIRPIAGEHEVPAYMALHTAAFGRTTITEAELEGRHAFMCDTAYIADLDLVVVAPDGTLAAFCAGQLDAEGNIYRTWNEGSTDPIGTHPAFRRRGLARAALLAAMQRLRAYGADIALLGTGSWNTATQRLCRSVGFQTDYRVLWYTKTA